MRWVVAWRVSRWGSDACEARRGPQIKSSLISTGFFSDSLPTHVVAGLGAGFLAVCVGSPVDVVKSRMMGARPARAQDLCLRIFLVVWLSMLLVHCM